MTDHTHLITILTTLMIDCFGMDFEFLFVITTLITVVAIMLYSSLPYVLRYRISV